MRLIHTVALLTLAAPLFTSCLGSGSSVNVYGGVRELETDDFNSADLDEQTVYGADLVWKTSLPFTAIEGGIFRAEEDASGNEITTDEFFVGARITPWTFLISPYASAGVTYVDSEIEGGGGSDSDDVVAYYLRLGAAFSLAMFRIGLDARGLFGSDVEFDSLDTDLDSYQLTAFIGIGF
jgi:hypothetical protein